MQARRTLVTTSFAVCVLALLLLATSFITLDHLRTVYLDRRPAVSVRWLFATLRPVDALPLALVLAAVGAIGRLEWRAGGLRRLLEGEVPALSWLAAFFLLAWFGHAILMPGLIISGDGGTHVARVAHLAMAIRDGASLYWDNYFFGGGLLLQFTGPLFHWLATLVTLALGDATISVKLVAFAARVAAGLFMLGFLRRAGLGWPASFLGTMMFGGSLYMGYIASVRSTFPQLINLAAIAAMLLCLEELLRRPRLAGPAWFGLCLAGIAMIGNHPPTAVMAAVLLGLYAAARMAGARDGRPLRALLPAALVTGIGAIYFLLPFALEKQWSAEPMMNEPVIGLALPTAQDLRDLLLWGHMGGGASYAAWIGTMAPLLALAGGALWPRARRLVPVAARLWLTSLLLALLSLFLVGSYVRPVIFTFALTCVAAAAGAQMLFAVLPGWRRLPVLLLALFMIEALPGSLLMFTRPDFAAVAQAGRALAVRAAGERVVQVTDGPEPGTVRLSVGPDSTPLHYGRVQMLHGPHKLDATKAHNAMAATLGLAQADLNATGALGADARLLLAQYNVGWLVGIHGNRPGLPARVAGSAPDPVIGPYLRLAGATPVLAAGRFVAAVRPPSFDVFPFWNIDFWPPPTGGAAFDAEQAAVRLVRAMDIDLDRRSAGAFLVAEPPHGAPWPAESDGAPRISLDRYEVSQSRVRLSLHADRPGLLRLAHPVYPGLVVSRNGAPVAYVGDVFSMIVLPIVAGENDIELAVHPSRLRRDCLAVSGVVGLLLLVGLAASLVRSGRRGAG